MPKTILKLHLQFRTKLVPPRCRYQAAKINWSPVDLEVCQEQTSLKSTGYDREKSRYSNPSTWQMADTKKLCNLYELAQLSSQSAEEDSTETSSSRRGMTSWGGEDLNSSSFCVEVCNGVSAPSTANYCWSFAYGDQRLQTLQLMEMDLHLSCITEQKSFIGLHFIELTVSPCKSYRLTLTLKESLLYVLMHVCVYAHIVFKSYRQLPIDMKIQGTCMCSLSMTRHIQMSSSFTLLGHPLYELPLLPQYMCTLQDTCQSIHLFDWFNRK